jgi:hypothetical protein
MAKASKLNPLFYWRRYVCFMARQLSTESPLPLMVFTALIFGFAWGMFPTFQTIFNSGAAVDLLSSLVPYPEEFLTFTFWAVIVIIHMVGSVPLSRILQIYWPDYYDLYRDV